VVEVDFGRFPGVVEVCVGEAVVLVVDKVDADQLSSHVDARLEPTAEQVDSHDAEDQPEHEADDKHVEDGRNCLDQSVHHHLQRTYTCDMLHVGLQCVKCTNLLNIASQVCLRRL